MHSVQQKLLDVLIGHALIGISSISGMFLSK
jgi:hypothetical protein